MTAPLPGNVIAKDLWLDDAVWKINALLAMVQAVEPEAIDPAVLREALLVVTTTIVDGLAHHERCRTPWAPSVSRETAE
jgi:hypothetical protein